MRIAVRADATSAIGLGHVKRCLALAMALKEAGAALHFIGHVDSDAALALVTAQGFGWTPLPPLSVSQGTLAGQIEDARHTAEFMQAWAADMIVVDHYGLAAPWHQAVRQATGANIVAIDDLADRPLDVDLLIDHNAATDHAEKYRHVLRPGVPLCGGPAYALIDKVYAEHARCVNRHAVQHIGIFMGGTDPGQHSAWALKALRETVGWPGQVTIATTSANPHWPDLARLVRQDANASLLMDQPHLADFHAACDLEIGAGGGAQWERCCLGVPTLALVCADNQRATVSHLQAIGALQGLDALGQTETQARSMSDMLNRLISSPGERLEMARQAMMLVDGHGAQRAAQAISALR